MIEIADRYIKTYIDFLTLRPRRFIAAKNKDPKRYLPPNQFLVFTLGIGIAIQLSTFTLILADSQLATTLARAVAITFAAMLVVVMFLESIFFRAISRIWPIRGIANFSSIFGLQCYMSAFVLPGMVIDLLGTFLVLILAKGLLAEWKVFLANGVAGLLIGILSLLFWNLPGIAAINKVSTRRVLAGYFFWPVALGFIVCLFGGIVLIVVTLLGVQ